MSVRECIKEIFSQAEKACKEWEETRLLKPEIVFFHSLSSKLSKRLYISINQSNIIAANVKVKFDSSINDEEVEYCVNIVFMCIVALYEMIDDHQAFVEFIRSQRLNLEIS